MFVQQREHFTGIGGETCAAGVKYAAVTHDHEPVLYRTEGEPESRAPQSRVRSLPCIAKYNLGGAVCAKCEMPIAEEVAAEEREWQERFARVAKARAAIVAHLGGPWKKGTPGARGAIDCPCCGKPGALRFSRSGYNGHIHARCETPGCCSWME